MINGKKIGLALSGGGYRAAAFHLGTLKKLNELNLLDKVDVISTVSGGSITGAAFSLHTGNFIDFENKFKQTLQKSVIARIIFSRRMMLIYLCTILVFGSVFYALYKHSPLLIVISLAFLFILVILLICFQFKFFPLSRINERIYDQLFFHKKKLSDLSFSPILVINATNLETTTLFTFSKNHMGDSTYSYKTNLQNKDPFEPGNFPVAKAVAASTCVPYVFSPVKISKQFYKDLRDYHQITPNLIDGGIYDNQGIHKITQVKSRTYCDIIITSDAGNIMPFQKRFYNTIGTLIRTSDVLMRRIKSLQFIQNIYLNKVDQQREIAYFSLGWNIENCFSGFSRNIQEGNVIAGVINAHKIPSELLTSNNFTDLIIFIKKRIDYSTIETRIPNQELIDSVKRIKTNLTSLSIEQIEGLISYAGVLAEVQVKLYCPSLFN